MWFIISVMKAFSSKEILEKYLKFFGDRNHKQVPNMSLVPEGDSTLLFVNSGMFPLVPYLSGQKHPLGKRLMNVQRSLRVDDIEEVGSSNRHTTAFHMIGNWSLGDYFKEQQLNWAYEFLVEELGLDINKMYATVFKGDKYSPKDTKAIQIIQNIFKKYRIDAKEGERIFACGREDNWWQRGNTVGELGGPDSEIFYYTGKNGNGFGQSPEKNQDEFIEIGNSVFMQYQKTQNGWEELTQKNVDFGGGIERLSFVVQKKGDIYETDNFYPIVEKLEELTNKKYRENKKEMRVIADHMRSSVLLAMDGVKPSNKDQGYILRRLLRRMTRFTNNMGFKEEVSSKLIDNVINLELFKYLYPELEQKKEEIIRIFKEEEKKFAKTLERAQKIVDKKTKEIDLDSKSHSTLANLAYDLYQSEGYPPEMFFDDIIEKGIKGFNIDHFWEHYNSLIKLHKDLSRTGAEQRFKGGLADNSKLVIKYHTATHLLQKALQEVLGEGIRQKGSNNTKDRLRFDFNLERALTNDEIKKVENIINDKIKEDLPVNKVKMQKDEAKKTGALFLPDVDYPKEVFVYYVGHNLENAWSKELCGGPHVKNLKELGAFKIIKEE
ncbi:alanine--tRNA ligase, partial [candidate division WWE3 bacterium CG10_big_fil_rev_8_21_14_0_10_32_10]